LLPEQQSPKDEPRQVWPPLAAPQRPSVEGFDGVGGVAEAVVDVMVVVDVVVDAVVEVGVPVVDASLVPNTISVVYVDFEVSSMVVVKISVLPSPHDSGVYSGGFSVLV
jgi:hypothetical protein